MSDPTKSDGVAVLETTDQRGVGMGIVVDSRHVLTCAHVVNAALGRPVGAPERPEADVAVSFPLDDWKTLTGRVVGWFPMRDQSRLTREELEDIAVLELGSEAPTRSVRFVASENVVGRRCRVYGFPDHSKRGNWSEGKIQGLVGNGWYQIDAVRLTGVEVQTGFSGAAVWVEALAE